MKTQTGLRAGAGEIYMHTICWQPPTLSSGLKLPNGSGKKLPAVQMPQKTPLPPVFKTYGDFAIAALNNLWPLSMIVGCAYYNAACINLNGKKYIYVSMQNINQAFWFWENTYSTPAGMNMGTALTYDDAKLAGIAGGLFLVCPDRYKDDGGFGTFLGQ